MPLTPLGEQARQLIIRLGMCGAREELSRMNAEHPEDDDLRAFYALALIWTGKKSDAETLLLVHQSTSAGPPAVHCEIELNKGNQAEAQRFLNQALERESDHYLTLRSLITIKSLSHSFVESEAAIARALNLFPEDPEVFYNQVSVLLLQKKLEQLEQLLDGSPDWFKASSDFHIARGNLATARRQLPIAEQEYQQAVAILSTSATGWAYLARTQVYQGKVDEANRSANFALELNPEETSALSVLHKIARDSGDLKSADELEKRRKAANPFLGEYADITKATELVQVGRIDEALSILNRVSKSEQALVARTARSIALTFLIDFKRWNQAKQKIEEIEAMGETTVETEMAAAEVLLQEGNVHQAVEAAKSLLKKNEGQFNIVGGALRIFVQSDSRELVKNLIDRLMLPEFSHAETVARCIMELDSSNWKPEARALFDATHRRFPQDNLMKCIAVGFAAEDDDLRKAFRLMRELPPNLRPRIGLWNMFRIMLMAIFKRP